MINRRWLFVFCMSFSASCVPLNAMEKKVVTPRTNSTPRTAMSGGPFCALLYSRTITVEEFIEKMGDVDIKDLIGQTALHTAVYLDLLEIVEDLLRAKADPDLKNSNGWTPLMIAASKKNKPIVTALLRADADANICNNAGETAADLVGPDTDSNSVTIRNMLLSCQEDKSEQKD